MSTKIAFLMYGIHYMENHTHWLTKINHTVDFREYYKNIKTKIIDHFSESNEIDIFLCTTHSNIEHELIQYYNPKLICFNDGDLKRNKLQQLLENVNMYQINNNVKYDYYIITRFDIYFMKDFFNIDYNKFNLVSILESHDAIDDSFYFIPRKYFEPYCNLMDHYNKMPGYDNYHFRLIHLFHENFEMNYLYNEYKHVADLSFYKLRFFIQNQFYMNRILYTDNITYYTSNKQSEMTIKDNIIHFKKNTMNKDEHCWIGYDIPNVGLYQLSFEIYSDKDIEYDFIHLYTNNFYKVENIKAHTWTKINVLFNSLQPNELLCFTFDHLQDTIDIQYKNINIENFYENVHFAFYGFTRRFSTIKNIPMKSKKYIFVPQLKYEDRSDIITKEDLFNVFKNIEKYEIWNYDKNMFIQKHQEYPSVPRFNAYHQQPYRTLSQLYHIKKSLELINLNTLNDESILILSRIDNSIFHIDYLKLKNLLIENEIIIQPINYFYFIIKKNTINTFITLYDSYLNYCELFYNSKIEIPDTTPENIFSYHFKLNNKKVIFENVIDFDFIHECSIHCGHHGANAQM
jgi:hypothetical protein